METTGMGRSTARRLLSGPRRPDPKDQNDKRGVKPRLYGDDARLLLGHVWMLMGMSRGKYFVVMRDLWLPLLDQPAISTRRSPPTRLAPNWRRCRRRPWTGTCDRPGTGCGSRASR